MLSATPHLGWGWGMRSYSQSPQKGLPDRAKWGNRGNWAFQLPEWAYMLPLSVPTCNGKFLQRKFFLSLFLWIKSGTRVPCW